MSEAGDRAVCETCQWWAKESSAIGYCHRFPTSLAASPSHWCGEHRPLADEVSPGLGYDRPEQAGPRRPGRPRKNF